MSAPDRQAANQDSLKKNPPLWVQLCFVAAGLGFDWDCAFEWFSKKYSLFSEPVLFRMGRIVVWCAAFSFLILLVVRRAKLTDAAPIFFVVSGQVWFYLTTTWIAIRTDSDKSPLHSKPSIRHQLVPEKYSLAEVVRKIAFRCYVFTNFLPRTSYFLSSTMRIASEYAMCSCSRIFSARVCSSSESRTVTAFCTMMAP